MNKKSVLLACVIGLTIMEQSIVWVQFSICHTMMTLRIGAEQVGMMMYRGIMTIFAQRLPHHQLME